MNNKKKIIIAIFITILIGVLTILGSFALWTSTVGNNINVAFNTANLNNYIDYTAGKAVFAGNLETTNVYSGGTSTIFKINKKNNPAYPFYASLNIKINNISKILTESRVLKWTVTSKTTGSNNAEVVVAQSDFVGTKVGDIIQLVPNLEVTTTSTDYNVYLWVDSTNANASSVSGEKIDIELWMDVYQYRAPKVLDVYCHNDGVSAMCNILDSEKSLSQYKFDNNTLYLSNSYTNISSTDYWTSINGSVDSITITVKANNDRTKTEKINGSIDNSIDIPSGLIPISFGSAKTGTNVTVADYTTEWYNYDKKEWANAVLVSEDTHPRNYYLSNPGTVIPQEDILAYYVWIPRYSYKVWKHSGISANGQEKEIEIKFISTSTIETATQNDEWHTHPAFWWDKNSNGVREVGEELSGIWVGKFEISHDTLSASTTPNCLGTCDDTSCVEYSSIRILPEKLSLKYNSISRFFYASYHMTDTNNPYGLSSSTVDSHMIKNSEWGAIAYLSHSKYGINGKMTLNKASAAASITTGRGNSTPNYGTAKNYLQSTTGNVTGVFDMAGGAYEYVMGVHNSTISSSEFTTLPDSKYYDNYPSSPFNSDYTNNISKCTFQYCGGHALNETKNWYGSSARFVNSTQQWFIRGGGWNGNTAFGIFYYYDSGSKGASSTEISTHYVIIKK